MMFPPSLPAAAKERAFRAASGELGVLPSDAALFLASCRSDGVEVFGWKLWLVGHRWDFHTSLPVPAEGAWSGGIPVTDQDVPTVIGGEGDADETERQLTAVDLVSKVQPQWLPHVRVNFTLRG